MNPRKQLAAKILKTSPYKVSFDTSALKEIKEAITRSDIRGLIAIGKIKKKKSNEQSFARARKNKLLKRKGRQKGRGSKKGTAFSIVSRKEAWMLKVRVQKKFLKDLRSRGIILASAYRTLYNKSKGGYFRNKRHIKLYVAEQKQQAQEEAEAKAKAR